MSNVNTHHLSQMDILIVEDDIFNLKFISGILREAGYMVRSASDGELALRSVQVRLPALVLLDIEMPGLDGYEVCRRLKDAKDSRDIPVIFLSVRDSPLDKVKAFGVGGVDYISKPFEPQEVLARVATHLALWKAKKEVEGKNLQLQQEITERKRAEETLQKHRVHLEELVAERTAELNRRVVEVEELNQGMGKLLKDLQSTNHRLSDTARQLETSNKELEAFTYSVSHDLRTPLCHIDGFVHILIEREAENLEATSARYLNAIAESSDRMGHLIDDLLAFSRTGQVEMQTWPVELNELVKTAQTDLSLELEGRRITWEIASLPAVEGDPALLRQVWVNLLSNAIKYTAPRAVTHIQIGVVQYKKDDIENRKSKEVTIFVRDNGVGFNPQYAHKLFGVFQRLHREDEFEGIGIGLATVQRIIHRHGGRVWAEGEVDGGATFYFTLKCL